MKPPARGFEVEVAGAEGTSATVRLIGELDLVTAPVLQEHLSRVLQDGARQVTLDLAALRFIDSSGLAAMVSALRQFRAEDGDIVLRSPTRATAKVLEICGLSQVFTIEPSPEAEPA